MHEPVKVKQGSVLRCLASIQRSSQHNCATKALHIKKSQRRAQLAPAHALGQALAVDGRDAADEQQL